MQVTVSIKASHNLYESEFRSLKGLKHWLKEAAINRLNEATTGEWPELYPGFQYDEGPAVKEVSVDIDRYIRHIASCADTAEEARQWEQEMVQYALSGGLQMSLQEGYEDILNPVEFRVA